MTILSTLIRVATPCCGTHHLVREYSSLHIENFHLWSDGRQLWQSMPTQKTVCQCSCGHIFLPSSATEVARHSFTEPGEDAQTMLASLTSLEELPAMTAQQTYFAIASKRAFPDSTIERLVRIHFWHLLNDRYREVPSGLQAYLHPVVDAPWAALSDTENENLLHSNLIALIPLLENHHRLDTMILGDAHRAMGNMPEAINLYKTAMRAATSDTEPLNHLISMATQSSRRVVGLVPPTWEAPPQKPEPWINSRPCGTAIQITQHDYWYKIVGMLQQVWALIEPQSVGGGVCLYRLDDGGEVYRSQTFQDLHGATQQVLEEGWQRFDEDPEMWELIVPPGTIYQPYPSRVKKCK